MGQVGSKKTLKEQLRENKRVINRAIRELDRERTNMERQEKKIVIDIKKAAKENQMGAVKILAKDLVRIRNYKTKFYGMRSQLQTMSMNLEMAKSNEAMASALQGTTKAMQVMGKQYNLPKMQKIMMEFAKQSEKSEFQNEMIGEVLDDVMGEEGDVEEEDKIVGQVLDEIGVTFTDTVPEAPEEKAPAAKQQVPTRPAAAAAASPAAAGGSSQPSENDSTLSELEARLNNLRRE